MNLQLEKKELKKRKKNKKEFSIRKKNLKRD